MAFTIDEAYLPATLTAPPMTDEQFAEFCAEHPDLFFETTADGVILVMPPNYSLTGAQNLEIAAQLRDWTRSDGWGIAGDSSTGFVLPNGARRSPDACWTAKARVEQLSPEDRKRYWRLSPDFVIELKSHTDRIRALREKMQEWITNGSRLAWLIDPETRSIEIYRPDREPERMEEAESVRGEGPVEGFELDLARVWDPLG